MIKNEKTLGIIYGVCIGQFILALILTTIVPTLDKKLTMLVSAILGILISGAARRSYSGFLVHESTRPLDINAVKDHKER